jgi:hypothetical protein
MAESLKVCASKHETFGQVVRKGLDGLLTQVKKSLASFTAGDSAIK